VVGEDPATRGTLGVSCLLSNITFDMDRWLEFARPGR
jgi:hypothetical protein